MKFKPAQRSLEGGGGFTLVELAVLVVSIGVLAVLAVPRFLSSVERSKAAEAFNYLSAIHLAQSRYHARHGAYASALRDLDFEPAAPEYFSVGRITAAPGKDFPEAGWELTLTRKAAPAGHDRYTVVFNQAGFEGSASTIAGELSPRQPSAP